MDQNQDQPRFTVIVPCRNVAGLAPRCLASIAKQTFPVDRVEVIAVDDVSTDATPFALERFGADLPRFRLIRNERRRGCGGSRNAAQDVATGEYLFYVDADDRLPDRSLERIDAALTASGDADVCVFPYRIDALPGSGHGGLKVPPFRTVQEAAFSANGAWTNVSKRTLAARFPENVMSEDCVWHFRQFDRFETLARVEGDEPCYIYDRTVGRGSITDTNEWLARAPRFLEDLALGDVVVNAGYNDRWVSDMLRNTAAMYDVRHELTKPWVKEAWRAQFIRECRNLRLGFYTK